MNRNLHIPELTLVKPFNAPQIVMNTIEILKICIPDPDIYIMKAVVNKALPGEIAVSQALLCFKAESSIDFKAESWALSTTSLHLDYIMNYKLAFYPF